LYLYDREMYCKFCIGVITNAVSAGRAVISDGLGTCSACGRHPAARRIEDVERAFCDICLELMSQPDPVPSDVARPTLGVGDRVQPRAKHKLRVLCRTAEGRGVETELVVTIGDVVREGPVNARNPRHVRAAHFQVDGVELKALIEEPINGRILLPVWLEHVFASKRWTSMEAVGGETLEEFVVRVLEVG